MKIKIFMHLLYQFNMIANDVSHQEFNTTIIPQFPIKYKLVSVNYEISVIEKA